jgi:hypothetical protein
MRAAGLESNVTPNQLDHNYERGINDGARVFRVELLGQISGTFDIGETAR